MDSLSKLLLVKMLHTVIWIFFNLVLGYLFYAVIYDRIDLRFWLGVGMILIECIVLITNKWTCPLSPIARRYTSSTKANFDIFLPNWLAKNNLLIYSGLLIILVLIVLIKRSELIQLISRLKVAQQTFKNSIY